ncbi:MAG: hypothetical protein JW902_00470 [Syntrophaceae bacterium]|nr:hypothetical protein [Syntrophaceae bacterium]
MTSKRFFLTCLGVSLLAAFLFAMINICMNDYGLFGDVRGRLIPIYANERTSKYLFSYNYIPANFEGLLLGSSLSNNLNTKDIKQYKIYNGSLSGANFTELKLIAENVIKQGKLKYIIICLHPYTIRTHGRRSSFMDPHEYWESLGSLATLELYRHKVLFRLGDKELISNEYGYHDRNLNKHIDAKRKISEAARNLVQTGSKFHIDMLAYRDLADIVACARENRIKIFAYFHPYPHEVYIIQKEDLEEFRNKISRLFNEMDSVWDFNSEHYLSFRKDYANFIDHTHLSPKGAQYILNEIVKRLDAERII